MDLLFVIVYFIFFKVNENWIDCLVVKVWYVEKEIKDVCVGSFMLMCKEFIKREN